MTIPYLTTDQMREVDRAMVDDYGILLIQMMENAGRNLANLARTRFFDDGLAGKTVLVLAGTGGNGGGGLVCARRLHNWGANVAVWLSSPVERLAEVPRHQLNILEKMEVPVHVANESVRLPAANLIVDALIGYSLKGNPREASAALINAANAHDAPVLSLDTPSGVDTSTGVAYEPVIRATATMTLALPKEGLRADSVRGLVGELYLADIGVPPSLYSRTPLNLDVGNVFAQKEVIRLW